MVSLELLNAVLVDQNQKAGRMAKNGKLVLILSTSISSNLFDSVASENQSLISKFDS